MPLPYGAPPLISVIITCYNHGRYLPKAIDSVLRQGYQNIEIVIIDDGSSDNTPEIVSDFAGVKYIYQDNKGLSAARNAGIKYSKGIYLVFLDADDWLLADALSNNVKHLLQNSEAAMVAGAYIEYSELTKKETIRVTAKDSCTYHDLLAKNYLRMHGAAMFSRWVFNDFQYDILLPSCEDWDLYLKIARKFNINPLLI